MGNITMSASAPLRVRQALEGDRGGVSGVKTKTEELQTPESGRALWVVLSLLEVF